MGTLTSGAALVPVDNGLHLLHNNFVWDARPRIGESALDCRAEPCVIFGRVLRRHEVRRRIKVRGLEAIEIWRIVGHGGTIAEPSMAW